MRTVLRRLATIFLVVVASTAGTQAAESWKLAITDIPGLEKLQVEYGPFKQALEKATGMGFTFFPVNNRTAAAEALKFGKVDFVLTGPAEYVVIRKRTEAQPVIGFGRPDYFSAIVVMAESGITTIQQLKGKKIAFSDVGSTSSHLGPMQLLADYGLDPRKDIKAIHTSRNIMHESLKRGDVAAIGFNYRTWVERARDPDKSMPPGAFRVIARGGDLPNDVLMAGKHVPADAIARIRKAVAANEAMLADAIMKAPDDSTKFRGMKFVTNIKDSDYDTVRRMYATIGYPEYADFVGN